MHCTEANIARLFCAVIKTAVGITYIVLNPALAKVLEYNIRKKPLDNFKILC